MNFSVFYLDKKISEICQRIKNIELSVSTNQ